MYGSGKSEFVDTRGICLHYVKIKTEFKNTHDLINDTKVCHTHRIMSRNPRGTKKSTQGYLVTFEVFWVWLYIYIYDSLENMLANLMLKCVIFKRK